VVVAVAALVAEVCGLVRVDGDTLAASAVGEPSAVDSLDAADSLDTDFTVTGFSFGTVTGLYSSVGPDSSGEARGGATLGGGTIPLLLTPTAILTMEIPITGILTTEVLMEVPTHPTARPTTG